MWDGLNESETYASGQVTIIDRVKPKVPTVKESHTTKSISLTVTADDGDATNIDGKSQVVNYAFSNDGGITWKPNDNGQTTNTFTFENLTYKTNGYDIMVKVIDRAKNFQTSSVQKVTTTKVPDLNNNNTKFSHQPDGWTSGPVTVKVTPPSETPPTGTELQYSTDGGSSWHKYDPSTGVSIQDNDTNIEFRYWDGVNDGTHVKDTVTKIDKQFPTVDPSETHTTNSAHVQAKANDPPKSAGSDQSGIDKYWFKLKKKNSTEDPGWQPGTGQTNDGYDFKGLEDDTDYEYYVKVTDKAGNTTEKGPYPLHTNAVPSAATPGTGLTITFANNKTIWVPSTTATINAGTSGYTIQYKLDNAQNWSTYTNSSISIPNNGQVVHARYWDGTNGGIEITNTSDHIDKLPPNTPSINATAIAPSSSKIKVTISVTDQNATTTSGMSDIQDYSFWDSKSQSWSTFQASNSKEYIGLTANTPYTFKVKVRDKAGNQVETTNATSCRTTVVPTLSTSNLNINYSPSNWTNGSVTVTVSAKNGLDTTGYTIKYSTNKGDSWADYQNAGFSVSTNVDIWVKLTDGVNDGDHASGKVTIIDKLTPNISIEVSTSGSDATITVTASDKPGNTDYGCSQLSGTYYYSSDGGTHWVTDTSSSYTFKNLNTGTTYNFMAKVIDKANNPAQTSGTSKYYCAGGTVKGTYKYCNICKVKTNYCWHCPIEDHGYRRRGSSYAAACGYSLGYDDCPRICYCMVV